jgi:hypothetical protein
MNTGLLIQASMVDENDYRSIAQTNPMIGGLLYYESVISISRMQHPENSDAGDQYLYRGSVCPRWI